MKTQSRDTSPEAEQVLFDLLRRATPARLRRRFADMWLGPELARRAYGELPDDSERS